MSPLMSIAPRVGFMAILLIGCAVYLGSAADVGPIRSVAINGSPIIRAVEGEDGREPGGRSADTFRVVEAFKG